METPAEAPAPRRLAVESEALLAGAVAAGLTGILAAFLFAGGVWPLWGGFSVGLVAAIAVLLVGIGAGATGYWRSRNLPGQEWRHRLKPWKFSVDVGTVAAVHAIIGFILTMVVFVMLQRSFEGLVVDVWTSIGAVAVASGLGGYWIYLSVSSITTPKLAMLLIVFMARATLASMATAQDPQWWEYHFSQLGTADDFSSSLFNLALIIGGAFVTTFALYVDRDLTTLVRQGVLERASAPRVVSVVFIVMGVLLAGVGLVPVNVEHADPQLLRGRHVDLVPRAPDRVAVDPARHAAAVLRVLLGRHRAAARLARCCSSRSATTTSPRSSCAAFSIIFGWISVFIRFVSALTVAGGADADGRRRSRRRRPSPPDRRRSERRALHAVGHDRPGEHAERDRDHRREGRDDRVQPARVARRAGPSRRRGRARPARGARTPA